MKRWKKNEEQIEIIVLKNNVKWNNDAGIKQTMLCGLASQNGKKWVYLYTPHNVWMVI